MYVRISDASAFADYPDKRSECRMAREVQYCTEGERG
jgi:hypothetical protein